jgi:single-strand DNA-binding protein
MFETYTTVVGRLATDVSQRTLTSGDKVSTFRMVSTERRFSRDDQEWVDGEQLWVNVTCWRKLAENVSGSLFKGDNVVIAGRLYQRRYEADGEPKWALELEAKAVGPNLAMHPAMITRPPKVITPSEPEEVPTAVAA